MTLIPTEYLLEMKENKFTKNKQFLFIRCLPNLHMKYYILFENVSLIDYGLHKRT